MFITNNHASFQLWWKENLLIYQNVSKYYEHGCLQNFLLLFIPLLTALIVKNSNILADIYFIFRQKHRRLNLEGFHSQIWTSVKRSGKYLSSNTNLSTFLHISCSNFKLKLCQRPLGYKNCQTNQFGRGLRPVKNKKLFAERTIYEILEKISSFHVK